MAINRPIQGNRTGTKLQYFDLPECTLVFTRISATGNSWRGKALYRKRKPGYPYRRPMVVEDLHDSKFRLVVFVRNPINRFVAIWWTKYRHLEFDVLLSRMEKLQPADIDTHLRPQWTFLNRLPSLEFLGNFEYLFEDWEKLRKRYPSIPMVRRRKELKGQPDWWLLIDDEQLERVAKFYERDLNQFGYLIPDRHIRRDQA